MDELKIAVKECMNSIQSSTELFYQQKAQEGYQSLITVIDGVSDVIERVSRLKAEGIEVPIDEIHLLKTCQEAFQAMENQDVVLLSDILEYELKEILEGILTLD